MTFREFYEPPFYSDGVYVWSNNGHMALMAATLDHNIEAMLDRLCQILNDEQTSTKNPNLTYSTPEILMNGKPFLTVRGWGALKSLCSTPEDAAKIQDDFAEWVITKLCNKNSED